MFQVPSSVLGMQEHEWFEQFWIMQASVHELARGNSSNAIWMGRREKLQSSLASR